MDLSGLDGGGCTEGSRRYGEDMGEGKEDMKESSDVVIYRRIVSEWDDNLIDLRND